MGSQQKIRADSHHNKLNTLKYLFFAIADLNKVPATFFWRLEFLKFRTQLFIVFPDTWA
jgi:hypothetical protein